MIFRCLFVCAAVAHSQLAGAREINVSDHGVVPGEDATYALNKLIRSVRHETGVTLVFPKGQYDFYPENAAERFQSVSNHDNSLKRFAFPLFGHKNLVIDGGGSTFMFHGRICPVAMDEAENIVLKKFSIDWQQSFHAELPVVESDPDQKTFVVEIDTDKYPYEIKEDEIWFQRYNWEDPFGFNIIFDPKTLSPIYNTKTYSLGWDAKVEPAGKNRVRFVSHIKTPPPVGSVLIAYGINPTSRLVPVIHVANSRGIHIKDVTVYDGGGMGLIAERTEDVSLDHFVVTSNNQRLVTTRADATHFVGCKGTIKLENCLFEHMLDDGINVHGAYVRVEEYLGNNEFLCAISHPKQWGLIFAEPGDKVAILSRETVLPFFNTAVSEFRILNEEQFVITLAQIPDKMPEGPLSMENLTWYPDLIMKNNTIRQNRARGALITTKGKVLLENNYFSTQMHGILIEGDNKKWYESGSVEDVVIKNNVFENIGFQGGPTYPLLASPMFTPEQRVGEGHYHRNIHFVDNTIKSFNGLVAQAKSVTGLHIKGNNISFSKDYSANSDFAAIELNYCDSVTVANNKATGFAHALRVAQSADTTNVHIQDNKGLE